MIQQIDLSLKEIKFAIKKLSTNDLIIKLQKVNFTKDAQNVKNCASYLLFSHQINILTEENRLRLKSSNFCKFRFCPMCNWRRSMNVGRELFKACKKVEELREVNYLFLTLTVKNPKMRDLKATVREMNKAFSCMSRTKAYKNAVLGHFKALEILGDNTSAGEAHPHFHILLIVQKSYFKSKNYLSQGKWLDMWKKALRIEYEPVIDIRRVKSKGNLTPLQSAVLEVAKYSVKHTDLKNLSNDDFKKIIVQTRKMRFYSTGGVLKEMIRIQKIDDELINKDELREPEWIEIEEHLYTWKDGDYRLDNIKNTTKSKDQKL